MELSSGFEGIDLEWFAIDRNGNLALFVTGGGGFVPSSVAEAADVICALSATIDTPHLGTSRVWEDYGSAGLYVYDWTSRHGSYGLVQNPLQPIPAVLQQAILDLPAVPRFKVDFGASEFVDAVDLVAT